MEGKRPTTPVAEDTKTPNQAKENDIISQLIRWQKKKYTDTKVEQHYHHPTMLPRLQYLPPDQVWRRLKYADNSVYEGECRIVPRTILPKTSRFQKHDVYDTALKNPLENVQVVVDCYDTRDVALLPEVQACAFVLHGQGRYIYPNGDVWDGTFCCNQMHGVDTCCHTEKKSNTTIQGTWTNGRLDCHARRTVLISYGNGDVYQGGLHEETGLYHGNGTLRHRNGTEWVGHWVQGEFESNMDEEGHMTSNATTAKPVLEQQYMENKQGGYKIIGTFYQSKASGDHCIETYQGLKRLKTKEERRQSRSGKSGGTRTVGGKVEDCSDAPCDALTDAPAGIGAFRYEGGMVNGQRHGFGTMQWLDDGTSFTGQWSCGDPIRGVDEDNEDPFVLPKSNACKMFCYLLDKSHYNQRPLCALMSSQPGHGPSSLMYGTRSTSM
jgi:hypothetical protein